MSSERAGWKAVDIRVPGTSKYIFVGEGNIPEHHPYVWYLTAEYGYLRVSGNLCAGRGVYTAKGMTHTYLVLSF